MKIRTFLTFAAAALGSAIGTPSAVAQSHTPVIPREVLFGNPTMVSPKISPDGTRLSYLAPVQGVLNVWVGPIDDAGAAKPVTADTGRGIRAYFWAYTNQHILFLQDEDGRDHWRLYSADLTTGAVQALTPDVARAPGADQPHPVSARVQHVSYKYPHDIIVALNDRDPRSQDLYVLNIDTGERVELQRNDGHFISYTTDDDYIVRFATQVTEDGGNDLMVSTVDGDWELFAKIPMEDLFTTGAIDFDKTGEFVYMVDSRGRDTAALKSVNIQTNAAKTLAKDRDSDISGGVLLHPTDKTVQAASSIYKRKQWHVVDDSVKDDFRYLGDLVDGELDVVSRSLDDRQWIVAYDVDRGPVRYYHYDRDAQNATFLFTNHPALDGQPLAPMFAEVIKSGDRQNLVSYYTLPVWSDAAEKGRPNRPLPMVVLVHGGPWWRDAWGFNAMHQWLSNRGYAVLSVNYRGSTGFGKKFIAAGNREWGGRMHDDLTDAVAWAVKKKIADEQRVAIMGASYGGYAALVGLTFTPQTFACGVDISGPASLATFLDSMPSSWQPVADLWSTRVGDPTTEEGRSFLAARSPLTFIDEITKPLLIAQGADDSRVKRSESDQIVQTMQRKSVPVTYVLYPDEGHGLADPGNQMSFFAVAENFLAQHLGGRAQPVGNDLDASSITIPVGGEMIASGGSREID